MKNPTSLSSSIIIVISVVSVLLLPAEVSAHLVTTGMGPVYDGIGHLLMTPADLMPVIAIALYAGLSGKAVARYTLFLLPFTWLAGGCIGLMVSAEPIPYLPSIPFLLMGGLVAADMRLPGPTVSALIIMLGSFLGFYNGIAMKEGPGGAGLLGIAVMAFVIVTLISSWVIFFNAHWVRVGVRVFGSWIAAVGVLLLGWMAKGAG